MKERGEGGQNRKFEHPQPCRQLILNEYQRVTDIELTTDSMRKCFVTFRAPRTQTEIMTTNDVISDDPTG